MSASSKSPCSVPSSPWVPCTTGKAMSSLACSRRRNQARRSGDSHRLRINRSGARNSCSTSPNPTPRSSRSSSCLKACWRAFRFDRSSVARPSASTSRRRATARPASQAPSLFTYRGTVSYSPVSWRRTSYALPAVVTEISCSTERLPNTSPTRFMTPSRPGLPVGDGKTIFVQQDIARPHDPGQAVRHLVGVPDDQDPILRQSTLPETVPDGAGLLRPDQDHVIAHGRSRLTEAAVLLGLDGSELDHPRSDQDTRTAPELG